MLQYLLLESRVKPEVQLEYAASCSNGATPPVPLYQPLPTSESWEDHQTQILSSYRLIEVYSDDIETYPGCEVEWSGHRQRWPLSKICQWLLSIHNCRTGEPAGIWTPYTFRAC